MRLDLKNPTGLIMSRADEGGVARITCIIIKLKSDDGKIIAATGQSAALCLKAGDAGGRLYQRTRAASAGIGDSWIGRIIRRKHHRLGQPTLRL